MATSMLRSPAVRGLLRSLPTTTTQQAFKVSPLRQQLRSQLCTRPTLRNAPRSVALVRFATTGTGDRRPMDEINSREETELGKQRLEAHPELVSATSSTHAINSELGQPPKEEAETEMLGGIKQDLKTIRDTFSLEGVPREAYYVGMAGVLPYLATSLSTVYCAWEINHSAEYGTGFLMSDKTAELALHVIEPLQIGYGAVIISFLGAIHWGLEWAGYGGHQGYPRYAIGVFSTAVAWPTILLPAEYALITQFLVFNFLYYADSRATKRGWCPQWYGVYRFVLTFIVGGAIVLSLIGRGQIADKIDAPHGASDRIRALRESQMESLEDEEEARRRFLAEKDEEEDEEEE